MLNVSQIIEAFGGYDPTRRLLGVSRSLLAEWETSGIPAKRWEQVAEIAGLIGRPDITVDIVRSASPSKSRTEAA